MNNEPTASGEPSHKAEPVAWAMFVDGNFYDCISPEEHDRVEGKYTVPLYTHSEKTLTGAVGSLSDEEIEVLARKHLCYQIEGSEVSGVFNFAKAILRKAQEK